jgi:quinoprotein glucose dehydrogenase
MQDSAGKAGRNWGAIFIGVVLGLVGLWLAGFGAQLLLLGGSAYYMIAGIGCLLSAWFYLRGRHKLAAFTYLAVFIGTCIWALAEVGTDFWLLVPRVLGPTVVAALVVVQLAFTGETTRKLGWGLAVIAVVAFVGLFIGMTRLPGTTGGSETGPLARLEAEDWTAFGRNMLGDRFSPASQITPENVGALEVAWMLRTGDMPAEGAMGAHVFEGTPLKVGDLVYICTPHARVVAADADTGKLVWRYDPKLDMTRPALTACRGVSWFETGEEAGECAKRIIYGTIDARLIAVDALTGKPCSGFGDNGIVKLRDGLGVDPSGQYFVTSPPAIANGVAVIGGFVLDGYETNEPSGVIRAYDATTGELAWSWDSGAVDENWRPKPGEHYTRGSPNAWTVIAADPDLGIVYLPMGNATPDYVGMHRTPEMERYSSSVVALDSRTGKRLWHFQTVRHDIWDYDLGSQPVLFDMPMPDGTTRKALAQPTKQGDIYISSTG